jgi:hypothetical protein
VELALAVARTAWLDDCFVVQCPATSAMVKAGFLDLEQERCEMWWFWWWLLFVLVLLLIPVGYGWGYRGWGPPYPYFYRRGRIRTGRPPSYSAMSSASEKGPMDTAGSSGDWGSVADLVWGILAIAAVWLLLGALWW